MKNYLTERLLTAAWLGALGYLTIPFVILSNQLTFWLLISAIVIALIAFFFGYFFYYKALLIPAEIENTIVARVVTATWMGCITYFITAFINSKPYSAEPSLSVLAMPAAVGFIFFILGWIFCYKLLLLPRVQYVKPFPSYAERSISMIWFGIIGYFLSKGLLPHFEGPNLVFITLLALYFGFYYGYRLMLLPMSLRGTVKSMMIGFIGSSYALVIIFFLLFFSMLMVPVNIPIEHPILETIALVVIFFLATSLFVCTTTIILSMLLYFLSSIRRVSK